MVNGMETNDPPAASNSFSAAEKRARRLDAEDPLRRFRSEFHIPRRPDGEDIVYLCGNSLGLQPRGVKAMVEQELDDWARLGVDGHFHGKTPWYGYHEVLRDAGARLVGGLPSEVVFMNSLTVNLHLMLSTFYRPTPDCHRILVDEPIFPSDRYALASHIAHRGLDPAEALVSVQARPGEYTIRLEDMEATLAKHGHGINLVLLSGVNFATGQLFDIGRLTRAAKRQGCVVGLDLAHAAGNVELHLHDWEVDFAVWCNYKYLNGGPGAVGGCFVHEKDGNNLHLPRLAGWWGNDPATRFRMNSERHFVPRPGADGWQLSNPPILAMAPLRASLAVFDRATMAALRAKSESLTGYLGELLKPYPTITPQDPKQRGCQVSLRVDERPQEMFADLGRQGIVCDFRPPNIIRVAPVPLYNTFHDVLTFYRALVRLWPEPANRGS
jgi:kynureninase